MAAWRFIELCWIVFFVFWIVAAFSAKRTIEGGRWWPRLAIVLMLMIAVSVLRKRGVDVRLDAGRMLWPYSDTVGMAAALVTLAGLAVTLWARVVLAGNWSAVVAFKEGHELIQRGPYRYVRHPIYSGVLLMALGAVIINGHLPAAIAFGAMLCGFWFKARKEERLLTRHFPEAYPAYKARVPALVPFLF